MSDTELTDAEDARLRQLLHRAADSLTVETPDADSIDLQPDTGRPARGRWLIAAAVVVLIAGGAVWLQTRDDADRIDTGPAEPPVTVAPQVLEQTGVWRLPDGLDGYRIVGAQDGGSFDSSSVDTPGVLAVDDPENPTRWLLVQAYDELGELAEVASGTADVALSDEVTATFVPTSGSTWFQVTTTGDRPDAPVIGGSALGIDETELTELLVDRFGTVDALAAAAGSTDTMEALLDDAGFGDDRLVWKGNGDGGPGSQNQQVQVTLAGDDGSEVTIIINQADSPAWATAVQLRLNAELLFTRSAGTAQGTVSVRPRPDLGRNVLESVADVPGQAPVNYLVVISDDSAWTSVLPTFTSATGLEPADAAPLPEDQQLRIINSLRAMSEDQFRDRLAELGADFVGAESVGVTTTVVSGPGG